jgi:ABC-type enterochelin transport system permease subunit
MRQIPRLTIRSSRRGRTINSDIEITDEAPKMGTTPSRWRVVTVCYLIAITVAMVGWLSAFGWVTVAVAKWLLD